MAIKERKNRAYSVVTEKRRIDMTDKNTRLAQVFINNKWENIDACDLRKGMHFRLFEADGTPVINNKNNTSSWIATSDIYEWKDGILAIDHE